jgi:hypothetical protein
MLDSVSADILVMGIRAITVAVHPQTPGSPSREIYAGRYCYLGQRLESCGRAGNGTCGSLWYQKATEAISSPSG